MKVSTVAIVAFASVALTKPIPDGENLVPVRWNDVEAGVQAAQASASASAAAEATVVNIAAREALDGPRPHHLKSGAEQGFRGGLGPRGRDVDLLDKHHTGHMDHHHRHGHHHHHDDKDHKHDQHHKRGEEHEHHEHHHDDKDHMPEDHNNPNGMPAGDKSGAENGGFNGGTHLWGRAPEPEPKKHGKHGKPNSDIVGANPIDRGGNHKEDPTWSRDAQTTRYRVRIR